MRSERYCFGIRIQKFFLYWLYRLKTNYMQLNDLRSFKNLTKDNLSIDEEFIYEYIYIYIYTYIYEYIYIIYIYIYIYDI